MSKRDLIRIYRKILKRPYTITALLLLLTSFFSFQKEETGVVLGSLAELKSKNFHPIEINLISPAPLPYSPLLHPSTLPSFHPLISPSPHPSIQLTAKAAQVLDRATHTVLYQYNPNSHLPIASLTKIATALVVLENEDLVKVATVPDDIYEKSGGSLMGLLPKEKISVENLLWGLLLNSGNDAGYTLAVNFPGGYNSLVEKMNEKVKFLRLKNTNFTNVVGFDDQNHFSTAYDLAVLTDFALNNPQFAQMVATREKEVASEPFERTDSDKNSYSQWHRLQNTNELLGTVEGVNGVKTGYTQKAGECIIVSVERQDHQVIIVLLGSENRTEDAKTLIDWTYENYVW